MKEQGKNIFFQKIKKEWLWAFGTTVLIGLIAHLYKFVNHLPNWDSLMDYYYPSHNMIHQGRQFQCVPAFFRGFADVPWVIGLLSLIYLGIMIAMLVELFDLHNRLTIIMTASLIVVSPSVISHWGYMFTADCYFFAAMLAVASVLVTLRAKYGFAWGSMLLALSIGIYQGYLSLAIGVILLWLVTQLLAHRNVLKQTISLGVMGVLALVLYKISLEIMCRLEGIPVENHQGIGSIRFPGGSELLGAIKQSYVDTLYYYVGSIANMNLYGVLGAVVLLLLCTYLILWIYHKQIYRQWKELMLIGICLFLFPCASHIFYFVTDEIVYHALMQFTLSVIFVLLFWLLERTAGQYKKMRTVAWISAGLLVYVLIIAANMGYQAQTRSYEKTYALLNRMVIRMEALPDFDEATHIAVIGNLPGTDDSIYGTGPALAGFTDGYFITHQKHIVSMLDDYFGLHLIGVDDARLAEIQTKSDIQMMGAWPQSESVKQIGDTIIIKLSE